MTQDFLAERLRERTKITRDLAVAQQAIRDQTGAANLFDKAGNIDRNKALESTLTLTQRLNQETAVQRQEMTARTAAEKEAAAIARARLDNRMAGAQAGSAEDRATREGNAALIARVQIQAQLSEASRARIQSANDNLQSIRAETAAMGGGIAAQERARTEQQLLADAKRQYQALGLSVPESEIEQFRKLAAAIGLARQEQAEQRAGRDLAFERDQFGRSGVDATIANRLRSVYGDDGYKAHMDGALAAQMRFNAELESTNGLFQGFGSTLSTELQQSKSFMDALTSATRNFTNTLLSSLMNESIRMLIGGLGQGGGGGGGLLGSIFSFFGGGGAGAPMQLLGSVNAKGNAFYGGNVIPFARGGVVSSPTMFPMAGGSMGLMGEAGAEAIMPLRRGPNGSLGVQVHDSGSRSSPAIVVNITNKSGGEVKTQSSTGSGGVNILDIVVEKVASETTNPGSPIYRAQQSMGGARPQLARR
jgi:phage-related minor tail protein